MSDLLTSNSMDRPQSPQRFFLNAPKQKDGECYVLNFDYMELDAYCLSLLRERDRLMRERDSLLAAIGDHVTVRSDQHAQIQRLRAALEQIATHEIPIGVSKPMPAVAHDECRRIAKKALSSERSVSRDAAES